MIRRMGAIDMNSGAGMGRVVSWESPAEVKATDLRRALDTAGLDGAALVRDMLPRNAFRRAVGKLSERRIVRVVQEDDSTIEFQFTREALNASSREWDYWREAVVTLEKSSGAVTCSASPSLASEAERLLFAEMQVRRSADISRLFQRIVESHRGDLVPLRKAGGVYFVPASHEHVVKSIGEVLQAIGGTLCEFLIHFGDPASARSVADELAAHLSDLTGQFRATLEGIGAESGEYLIARRQKRISELESKLVAYQGLLGDYAEKIGDELAEAKNDLLARMSAAPVTAD